MTSRVALLFNPASGRGKAERLARTLSEALASDGWAVDPVDVSSPGADPHLDGARAAVAIGGDGTVHRSAPAIAQAGVPMIIAPMGTENLLATELGMTADIEQIRRALRDGRPVPIDLPTVNGVPFLVMCSVGLDAAIVAEVDARRAGTIRKSNYLRPTLRQTLRPTLPALRIVVDGETVCDGAQGMLVVANCRRYGAGLNPAPHASMTDGLLDVAFYPMRHTLDTVRWVILSRLGRHNATHGFIKARGRVIEIANAGESAAPVQVDGEPAPKDMSLPLRFIADADRIIVLHDQ